MSGTHDVAQLGSAAAGVGPDAPVAVGKHPRVPAIRAQPGGAASQARLLGMEGLYALYKLGRGVPAVRGELEAQLQSYGFAGPSDFGACVAQFQQVFEAKAAQIALDTLARYAARLGQERQRYRDPAVVGQLYQQLGGFRTQHHRVLAQSQVMAAAQHGRSAELRRMPGNVDRAQDASSSTEEIAKQAASLANAAAKIEIGALAAQYPIFAEDGVPISLRIDKDALGRASEGELGGLLQAHIARRLEAVAEAREHITGNPLLVYRMAPLMPAFYAALGISPGSIFDQILQDAQRSEAITKLVVGLSLAIVALAATMATGGAAAPALTAAGSLIAAGVSAYVAYDEHKQYADGHALHGVGLADDPSIVWLVVAIAGVGLDAGAAASALRQLAPAARAIEAAGTVDTLVQQLALLKAARQLDDQAAVAIERAARARLGYTAAKAELKVELLSASGRIGVATGALADPAIYRALVKVAVAKLRQGLASSAAFVAEVRQARLAAKLGEMGLDEVARTHQAWTQAEQLTSQVKDPALVDKLVDSGLGSSIALDAPVLGQVAAIEVPAMRRLAELAHADPAAFTKYLGLAPAELRSLATLDDHALLALSRLDRPALARLSRFTAPNLRSVAALDELALRRLTALDPQLLATLDALRPAPFQRILDLALHDPATFAKLSTFDAAALDAFGALPSTLLPKLTALEPTALAKLAHLDAAALQKLASLDPDVLSKFARLRYPDMLAKFGACELPDLIKLGTLERSVLEKFGGWEAGTVKNISRLKLENIRQIALLKVAPGQAAEAGLASFRTEQFRMGSDVFQIDSRGMKHILERHHPLYWDGSVKVPQSFLDARMTVADIQDAIRSILQQNRERLIRLGTNDSFQMTGTYGGRAYTLGVMKGSVRQLYPM